METDIFTFDLPAERIAQMPMIPRDKARLLWVKGRKLQDKIFCDLPDLLRPTDVLVFNDTRVIPARLYGRRGVAQVVVTLFKQVSLTVWDTLIKNARRLKEGDIITFDTALSAKVIQKGPEKTVRIAFLCSPDELMVHIHRLGKMPLPPYIKRGKDDDMPDDEDYQTVYAKNEGAVAAPTAGLHFTPELIDKLHQKGIQTLFVTLHVGGGTFLPVVVKDTKDHVMHKEFGVISKAVADQLNAFRAQGRRIIPVGTTALRLLESATDENGLVQPFATDTGIFITPGYQFRCTDALITNFHLSGSTLFMLVCALAGIDTMKAAYAHAIAEKYRFFSYGDACLIEKP